MATRTVMGDNATPHDPWTLVKTIHGLNADEVISSFQKSIRRGLLENAVLLAYEMSITSAELEEHLWTRLMVISVEDVGNGSFMEPVIVDALYRMHQRYPRGAGDRFLFATHAIRLLATGQKDRITDEMVNWAKLEVDIRGDTARKSRRSLTTCIPGAARRWVAAWSISSRKARASPMSGRGATRPIANEYWRPSRPGN